MKTCSGYSTSSARIRSAGCWPFRRRTTLKRVAADGRVEQTVDRRPIWLAYTPQMFRLGLLRQALTGAAQAGAEITDEASAIEWLGHRPRVVEGRADNIKVTRPDDLQWLQLQWGSR